MDPASLIAVTTLECAGWLLPTVPRGSAASVVADSSSERLAVTTQDGLVKLVRRGMLSRMSAKGLREALFNAINTASGVVVQTVPQTIAELKAAQARYLMKFEGLDGTVCEIYEFDQLPFIGTAWQSFLWIGRVRRLPQRQQALILRMLDLEFDLRNAKVHMRFAQEDCNVREQEILNTELGGVMRQIDKVRAQMSDDALEKKNEVLNWLSVSEIQRYPAVVEVVESQKQAEILFAALSMDRAGDSLTQALPIAESTLPDELQKAEAGWAQLSDLGNTLHVLAIWLRALAAEGGARRCELCFRHVGFRGKRFCSEHQRDGGKRQPAREFHIAKRYPDELESFAKEETILKDALASAGQMAPEELLAVKALLPEDLAIPERLIQPATLLFGTLRRAAPATDPELKNHVEMTWRELVRIASEPYSVSGLSSKEVVSSRSGRQAQALRWLSWSTFFRAWWARAYPGPGQETPDLDGRGFDVNHPSAQGYPVTPGELVMDLLRQRAWWRAGSLVDTEDYLSMFKVRQLKGQGKSLRSIADELGFSHEAVRQTLLQGKITTPTPERRLRVRKAAQNNAAPPRKRTYRAM